MKSLLTRAKDDYSEIHTLKENDNITDAQYYDTKNYQLVPARD